MGFRARRDSGGVALKRKSVASGTREKVDGSEKTRANEKKTGETPKPNRDKLKEMVENMRFVFFEAVQGFKQNNIVHQQLRSQIASVQRLQPIPGASIARTFAEKMFSLWCLVAIRGRSQIGSFQSL